MRHAGAFLTGEQGQDLTEYALLLAFVCIGSAALFLDAGQQMAGIWSAINSRIVTANHAAGS